METLGTDQGGRNGSAQPAGRAPCIPERMAHLHTNSFYPPAEIPKRHMPWFMQLMFGFALLVLVAVVYAFWQMGKVPARTLELPTTEQPATSPASNPPEQRPQRIAPLPAPVTPSPTPATP